MATSVDNHSEINCPICLEKFNLPKKLPCLHTFCEPCIQSYVQVRTSSFFEGDPCTKFFKCPVCRMETELANMSVSEWVQILPTDHLIQSLNLSTDTNDDSKTNEIFCDPCLYGNEKNVAKHHCNDCKEWYCEQCLNYLHKRKRNSNLHVVTAITDEIPWKPVEVDELCPSHTDKVMEAFCFDHKKLCCINCLASDHRKCTNVKTLDEIVSDEEECLDMEDFISNLINVEQCAESTLKESKDNLAELEGDKNVMLQSVDDLISSTKSHLDTLHGELKGSIEKTFSDTEHRQEFDIDCLVAFQKTLALNRRLTEAVKEHGSEKQKFLTMEKTKTSIEKDFESLHSAFNYTEIGKQHVLNIEDELSNVQKLSKLGTLNLKQSDEALTNLTEAICQLGCRPKCAVFEYSLPVNSTYFPHYSPQFGVFKMKTKWRLQCTKKNEYFGIFLQCLSSEDPFECLSCEDPDFSLDASVEVRIANQVDRDKNFIRTLKHKFHKNSGRGWNTFISWQLLISPEKGYISDGSVKIRVKVW